jgi:hypothetical protein
MTKLTLKYTCLFIIFFFCSVRLSAQDSRFSGKWQLAGVPPDAGIVFNKYYNAKGEFYNTRTTAAGSQKTHHGTYKEPPQSFINSVKTIRRSR